MAHATLIYSWPASAGLFFLGMASLRGFAKFAVIIIAAGPIRRVNTATDECVKTRIRPIADSIDVSVFHGVPMNVFHVFFKITLIADLMLPAGAGVACAVRANLCAWRTLRLIDSWPASAGLFFWGMASLRGFAKFAVIVIAAGPIRRVNALADECMKTRIRPIAYLFHVSVFYRVEMDVIHVPLKITLIADLMFPKSALPQA
jgi:hypothetical protein